MNSSMTSALQNNKHHCLTSAWYLDKMNSSKMSSNGGAPDAKARGRRPRSSRARRESCSSTNASPASSTASPPKIITRKTRPKTKIETVKPNTVLNEDKAVPETPTGASSPSKNDTRLDQLSPSHASPPPLEPTDSDQYIKMMRDRSIVLRQYFRTKSRVTHQKQALDHPKPCNSPLIVRNIRKMSLGSDETQTDSDFDATPGHDSQEESPQPVESIEAARDRVFALVLRELEIRMGIKPKCLLTPSSYDREGESNEKESRKVSPKVTKRASRSESTDDAETPTRSKNRSSINPGLSSSEVIKEEDRPRKSRVASDRDSRGYDMISVNPWRRLLISAYFQHFPVFWPSRPLLPYKGQSFTGL